MEQKLQQAFDHASDGLFSDILAECQQERMLTDMERNSIDAATGNYLPEKSEQPLKEPRAQGRRRMLPSLAMTAAGIILILGVFMTFRLVQSNQVATVVTLDLNPSVQLDVNKNDQVLRALALNDEGAGVLAGMKLEKTHFNVAINAIIGSMLQSGFMAEDINTFLISVDNKSEEKSAEMRNLIVRQLEALMATNSLEGMIISQKLRIDDAVTAMAGQFGISSGKAYLLRHIYEKYPEIPLDVLAAMGIGELADLFAHTIAQDEDVELYGRTPDDQQKLLDRASILTMLYERWQLDTVNIRFASIHLQKDDQPAFEVMIKDGSKIWLAVVDARTGEILSEEQRDESEGKPTDRPTPLPTNRPTATPALTDKPSPVPTDRPTATPVPTDKPSPSPTTSADNRMLSAADARRMVINRFGGIIQKIEYAYDDRNPMYKGEALKDGYKVVFEINARTSGWAKWDTGNDNKWDDFAHALPNMITMDQAARSVIDKSGKSNTFVQKIDFLWDDEKPLYQGEAFNKGVKYSFEIYAYGGGFQKWDVSTGDDTWAEKYYNVN